MTSRTAAIVATIALAACDAPPPLDTSGPVAGWPAWGGDAGGQRHSPLTQIDRTNVGRLEVAWVHHSGDVRSGDAAGRARSAFQATPILLGDTLYYCSPSNIVFALDAESGAERWRHDPGIDAPGIWSYTCRGVAAWESGDDPDAPCGRRIFAGTLDARLLALDAESGRPCADFGEGGSVDLTRGLGDLQPGEYAVTSPPSVIGDVVAVGALVGDGRRTDAPPGVVRGFDARSGALRWAWDPVAPGTPPPADGSRWHRGTANVWSVGSVDAERDLLFLPTGSAAPDFFGALRGPADPYGSSVVALRGSTGELVWHFRTVHHDLWDYDVGSQPTLLSLRKDGALLDAVAQPTKMGHVFLLHRETGAPVYPIEMRPVPGGDVPGETYAPRQPFPTHPLPLHPLRLEPGDAFGLTPWDEDECRERLESLRNEGVFTPPSLRGSVQYPGVAGGSNWGSASFDPERQLLVMNQNRVANVQTVLERDDPAAEASGPFDALFPQVGTPFVNRQGVLVSEGLFGMVPCNPPPWGVLMAVDLVTGRKRWEIPFGTTRGMAPWPFWPEWGLPSMGGPITTASGLVFIGAAMDQYLRAYDVETGEELWKTLLPAGGQATPMTYRLRREGRQLVVIAAGGHGTLGTRLGDSLIAFGLPDD